MLELALRSAASDFPMHLERLRAHIRQQSISTQPLQVEAILSRLVEEISQLGGCAEIIKTQGLPIAFTEFASKAPRTVAIHCMYDTVAADERDWLVPPFEARQVWFEGIGECIVGRGAEDTKGPYTAVLNAVDCYRSAKVDLPVSILLIMEGSELGSEGIVDFVSKRSADLRAADVVYFPWHTEKSNRTAVVWLGAKGLITLKIRIRGGEWGGPVDFELHGSQANWVANPIDRLVRALSSMKDAKGSVIIDGFNRGVEPRDGDLALIDALATRINSTELMQDLGVHRLKHDSLIDSLKSYCFDAEFNISGIRGGTVIEGGHRTQIPREAVASVEIRPLPGMSSSDIISCIRKHLDANGLHEASIEVGSSYPGGGTPVGNWAVDQLLRCYADCSYDPEVWPRTARSIAAGLYTEHLGLPWIATMPGHAGRQHAANEFVSVDGYRKAIEFVVRLLWRLGRKP